MHVFLQAILKIKTQQIYTNLTSTDKYVTIWALSWENLHFAFAKNKAADKL